MTTGLERIKDWPELRVELVRKAGSAAADELDRLLATYRKIQAIQLLKDNGISLVDPDRPATRLD